MAFFILIFFSFLWNLLHGHGHCLMWSSRFHNWLESSRNSPLREEYKAGLEGGEESVRVAAMLPCLASQRLTSPSFHCLYCLSWILNQHWWIRIDGFIESRYLFPETADITACCNAHYIYPVHDRRESQTQLSSIEMIICMSPMDDSLDVFVVPIFSP